ncbi:MULTISPECIES: hypothetical protein [Bacillus cereus group]|nr:MULTISPECIES: hypothetical protein [Bacillus cereus group]SCM12348.1 Protein of unknown function [Bacillus wiedmannii]
MNTEELQDLTFEELEKIDIGHMQWAHDLGYWLENKTAGLFK